MALCRLFVDNMSTTRENALIADFEPSWCGRSEWAHQVFQHICQGQEPAPNKLALSILARGAHGGTCPQSGDSIWLRWPLIGRSPSTPESHLGAAVQGWGRGHSHPRSGMAAMAQNTLHLALFLSLMTCCLPTALLSWLPHMYLHLPLHFGFLGGISW